MTPPLQKFILIQVIVTSFALGWYSNDTFGPKASVSAEAAAAAASGASSAPEPDKEIADEELINEVLSASPACVRDGAADAAKAASRQVSVDDLYAAEAKCLAESQLPAAHASSPSAPGSSK